MKFEEDFDFETANAQFHKDELGKELQNKLKLKGDVSSAALADLSCLLTPPVASISLRKHFFNVTTDEKTLNGEETGDLENVANEEEETVSNSCYYDKTKSFFDNLSCDNLRYIKSFTFSAQKINL